MINYEDIRIKKTIRNIHKSFIELFKRKDYEKITVKELIEKAEISKKTFYRYYSSIDNLFLEIQDKITDEYIQKFSLLAFPKDLKNIINTFIDFSEIYGNAHDKIIIDSKNDYVLQKMINNIIKKTWEKSDFFKETEPYLRNIILSFVFSSISRPTLLYAPPPCQVFIRICFFLNGKIGFNSKNSIKRRWSGCVYKID